MHKLHCSVCIVTVTTVTDNKRMLQIICLMYNIIMSCMKFCVFIDKLNEANTTLMHGTDFMQIAIYFLKEFADVQVEQVHWTPLASFWTKK